VKITNNFNLPTAIYNAVNTAYTPNAERMSVTDLIGPPLIRSLKLKHWDELEEDVSDKLWALLGSAVHYVLEKGASDSSLSEEKLTTKMGIFTLVGKPDLYVNEGIEDWKITSVYSFLLGNKIEWEQQLNVYKFLYETHGFPVKKLTINAILRDWQKGKSYEEGYPPIPFISSPVSVWSLTQCAHYIDNRLAIHSLEIPAPCTPEERWARPTKYAITKDGNKRATKLFDSLEEAEKSLTKGFHIDERPGSDIRCGSYCSVNKFCEYFKTKIAN
jgi:hypothetical protein